MPMALESFDLRGYDLIVSSESGPAKGVITPSHTRHVCYCHTPMRYLWDLYSSYAREWMPAWKRAIFAPVSHSAATAPNSHGPRQHQARACGMRGIRRAYATMSRCAEMDRQTARHAEKADLTAMNHRPE